MKKALLVFLLFALGWKPLIAQLLVHKIMSGSAVIDAEKKDIQKLDSCQYVQVSLAYKKKTETYNISLDIGDRKLWFVAENNVPSNVVLRSFDSQVAVYNYLDGLGWDYLDTIEDTRTTDIWAQVLFDVNIVKTKLVYIFKRKKK